MGIRLTLDVFSGRPNPTVEIGDDEADDLLARFEPSRILRDDPLLPASMPLGYRGVEVELTGATATRIRDSATMPWSFRVAGGDLFGRGLAHRAADDQVEAHLLAPDGPFARAGLEPELAAALPHLAADFARIRARPLPDSTIHTLLSAASEHAPLPDLGWWNASVRRPHNNCYNYSCNYRTDTFAQPGLAAGDIYHAITGPEVRMAAVRDQLVNSPNANNRFPEEGHLVALVIAPGWDYHWYRKCRSGRWTHKPGGTSATELDNSGHVITDPRTADRGPYTEFTTFMVVFQGHIKIA
jgi:hypothetical protein